MTTIQKIKKNITKMIANFQKKGLISNPRFPDKISSNCYIKTGIKNIKNINEYDELRITAYENDNYLFVFDDGAFFQVNYRTDNDEILSANLSYWPDSSGVQEYIRYDYSITKEKSFYHAYSHLHIGLKNEIRIPLNKVLFPSDFVLLVMYLYYKNEFEMVKGLYNIDTQNLQLVDNKTMFIGNLNFLFIDYKK